MLVFFLTEDDRLFAGGAVRFGVESGLFGPGPAIENVTRSARGGKRVAGTEWRAVSMVLDQLMVLSKEVAGGNTNGSRNVARGHVRPRLGHMST